MTARRLLVLVLVLVAAGSPARAQDIYEPPSDPFGYVTVQGAKALKPGEFFGAMYYDYSEPHGRVKEAHRGDLVGGYGLMELHRGSLAVGMDMPGVLDERVAGGEDKEFEPGDLRLDLKAIPFDRDSGDFFGIGGRIWTDFPTGSRSVTITNGRRYAAGGEVIFEGRIDFVRGAINAGYEWIEGSADDRIHIHGALAITPLRDIAGFEPLEVVFEATHRTWVERPWDSEEVSPMELRGALRWSGDHLFALVALGAALNDGFGAATPRFDVAVGYRF